MLARSSLLVVALLTWAAASSVSAASPKVFPPLERVPLFEEPLPQGASPPQRVKGERIRFAPGQPTALHLHPVSVLGVVTQGRFVFQREGESATTLETGAAFFEPARTRILRFDNASQRQPAEIVAFYLRGVPDGPLIEMLSQ